MNPVAPIPQGFGVKAIDPATGKYVYFDDCFRYAGDLVDRDMAAGDLAEAKGPRTEYLYRQKWSPALENDVAQAQRQLRVARSRHVKVKWYFAEKGAADLARARFEREKLDGIIVSFMPPRLR